jgi:branched-chain amino acid transport system ATP-binding protein
MTSSLAERQPRRPLLEIADATVRFGGVAAVDGAGFAVPAGSITGLIGPNGAGKSTLFNAITGECPLDAGSIRLGGQHLGGLAPDAVFARGLARTFQIPRPFAEMTALENLMLAAPGQSGERPWAPLLGRARMRAEEAAIRDRAQALLHFVTLDRVAGQAAGRLSGGQQKLLELARVLMGQPKLILLDEPAAGVNPALVQVLVEKIHALNAQGITFLIIEHDMDLVMRHCAPIVAMAAGRVIFQGDAAAARCDAGLLDAYLGAPEAA